MLGELLLFEGCFAYPSPSRDRNLFKRELGGGSYNDAAVYPLRASRMLFKEEPVRVACNLVIDAHSGVDTKADLLLSYPSGRSAFISSAFGSYFQSTYSVLGSEGRVSLERAYAVPKEKATKIFLEKNDVVQEIVVAPVDQFALMIAEFCAEIALGDKGTRPYEKELLAQARVVEAGRISHETEQTVEISTII
jgi:dTDP-3,4-didehydro-2,6-dideoxy-alpha-D-glucose 3-reductase